MNLADRLTTALTERQSAVEKALTTARLDKVESLQGEWKGLEEAKILLLSLLTNPDEEKDAEP